MNPSHDARANMDGVPTMNEPYTNSVDPHDRTLQSNINFVNGVNCTNQGTAFSPPNNGQRLRSVQSPVCAHSTGGRAMMANAVLNETLAIFHQVAGAVQATRISLASELTSPVGEQPEVHQVALQMQENEHMHQTTLALFQAARESQERAADRRHDSTKRAMDRSNNVNQVHAANRAHESKERTMDRTHESQERCMDRKQKEVAHNGSTAYEAVMNKKYAKAAEVTKVRHLVRISFYLIGVFSVVVCASQIDRSVFVTFGTLAGINILMWAVFAAYAANHAYKVDQEMKRMLETKKGKPPTKTTVSYCLQQVDQMYDDLSALSRKVSFASAFLFLVGAAFLICYTPSA